MLIVGYSIFTRTAYETASHTSGWPIRVLRLCNFYTNFPIIGYDSVDWKSMSAVPVKGLLWLACTVSFEPILGYAQVHMFKLPFLY